MKFDLYYMIQRTKAGGWGHEAITIKNQSASGGRPRQDHLR